VSTASNGDSLFGDGDPFDDPVWQAAELMAGAPPRPADGYITCTLAWLARVRPLVRSVDQLVVVMLLYRRCLTSRSRTVNLPNGELRALGISRHTKYRLLAWLAEVGAGTIEEVPHGHSVRVTLHWFP
jgi:hypothetical protein